MGHLPKPTCTDDIETHYEAAVYDYTHGRTILVNGVPFDPMAVSATAANIQPLFNADELAEAARLVGVEQDEVVVDGMPPVLARTFPNGTSHRILKLDISSGNSSRGPFYVNMNNGTVESAPNHAHKQTTQGCGAPLPAAGSAIDRGTPGRAILTITQNGRTLWTMEVTRPAASSGTRGSGIELQHVKYLGKTVLYQAHVPILNVEYEQAGSECGPHYRDWQYNEWPLQCDDSSTSTPSGFRLCSSPARSILDPPHTDGGNFAGVAIYVEGPEVVLKSQMVAGWYRYVSEWRFHVDGTLRPRFGFAAVYEGSHCVCQVHHHHVYWRLDFDIETAGNNLVREFNQPPIIGNSNFHDKSYEIRRPRDPSHQRHWEVSNTRTGNTYALLPGSNDGTADSFGVGDVWVLRYHGTELDDGVNVVGGDAAATMAHIDNFLTGEPLVDTDVVIWYAAHFRHDQSHEGGGSHIVGPDIAPLRW
jgi:hypothetical protein